LRSIRCTDTTRRSFSCAGPSNWSHHGRWHGSGSLKASPLRVSAIAPSPSTLRCCSGHSFPREARSRQHGSTTSGSARDGPGSGGPSSCWRRRMRTSEDRSG
jgi:hypothetical protein